ncbi:MAG: Asp-tRNA(Asn)/Glu-tRNA(Gln) amidotransferase subunit GatC [Leptonema sp. (in: Bacteria)]|nr:Asp-tRNA(Asn)/Glu-tRNA(Gln) amidotransferase subunit GatC [Leptonema sp. (in: bacteria)]
MNDAEFKELCLLARLDPKDESLKDVQNNFDKILSYVDQIGQIDTSSVGDEFGIATTRDVARNDEPKVTLDQSKLAGIAPDWESGHFVVPGIIESEG